VPVCTKKIKNIFSVPPELSSTPPKLPVSWKHPVYHNIASPSNVSHKLVPPDPTTPSPVQATAPSLSFRNNYSSMLADDTSSSSASSSQNPSPASFTPGELGKFATMAARDLQRLGWFPFVRARQCYSSLNTQQYGSLQHPVMPYLQHLATHGVPAPSQSKPWPYSRNFQAYVRGPHVSAAHLYKPFVLEDMFNMVREGYWCVLPFTAVAHMSKLKLSPAGVVPQRERRPRIILDYSFPPHDNVNSASLPIAPTHAMQFGKAFQRLIQRIVYCNKNHGPPYMAKLDLADGYYRVPLSPLAALELAVVLPGDGIHDRLVGIPLSLPMGWSNSPPYFCAYTETIADIANASLARLTMPPHPLEPRLQHDSLPTETTFTETAILPQGPTYLPPLSTVDVYLDDFMALAQPPVHTHTMRTLLHSIEAIFYDTPPTTPRRAVISHSKIDKGDASWSTTKTILGWLIDTASMTMTLPPHRQLRLITILEAVSQKHRLSRTKWQQLLGELRSMALAISGAKFHFSLLQNALTSQLGRRIRITSLLRTALQDWKTLMLQLSNPIALHSIVPQVPDILAGCDASLAGVGGWLWRPAQPQILHVWRYPFPTTIQRLMVSVNNPSGTVNNSELELAAIVLSAHIAADISDLPHPTIWCASDNMAAVAWANNGSTSSNSPSAFLLRLLGHLSQRRRFTLAAQYVSGTSNIIADTLSRRFDLSLTHLASSALPSVAPQTSLQIVHPHSDAISNVISALSRQIAPEASPKEIPTLSAPPGPSGNSFVWSYARTPCSRQSQTPSHSCSSLRDAIAQAPWLPEGMLSHLRRWLEPFVPWGRRWPHWDSQTRGSLRKVPLTYGLPDSWQPMAKKTHPQLGTNPYPPQSYAKPLSTAAWPTHPKLRLS
jgi:hypothetical protein